MNKIFDFLKEVRLELEKVTWPKQNEVVNYLGLLIVCASIVGIVVGAVDYLLTLGLENLLLK